MIQVCESNGKWMIVRDRHFKETGGITGSRSRTGNGRWMHNGCWTSENWAHQDVFALKFDTQEAAEQYLLENEYRMEG